jgi:hypothetical protein
VFFLDHARTPAMRRSPLPQRLELNLGLFKVRLVVVVHEVSPKHNTINISGVVPEICADTNVLLRVKRPTFSPDFNQNWNVTINFSNINECQNPFSGSLVVSYIKTARRTKNTF